MYQHRLDLETDVRIQLPHKLKRSWGQCYDVAGKTTACNTDIPLGHWLTLL